MFLAQDDRLLGQIYAILMSVRGYVGMISELLRRLVRRSSPITVIVVVVVMLMLCMLVVDNLGWVVLLDLYPEPGGVQHQRDDSDDEELELEVGAYQLQQQAEFRFQQHRQSDKFLQMFLLELLLPRLF